MPSPLAAQLARMTDGRPTRIVYGIATGPNTVQVAGATTAVELPAVNNVDNGDFVAVLETGADRLIIGTVDGVLRAGPATVTDLTATSPSDVNASGNGAVQIGTFGSGNSMHLDGNEIQRFSNGVPADLLVSFVGAGLRVGGSGRSGVYLAQGGGIELGWVNHNSDPPTAAAGWSIISWTARRAGDLVQFRLTVERTGGNITSNSAGNITDTDIAFVDPALRGNITDIQGCSQVGASRLSIINFRASDGRLRVEAISGGGSDLFTGGRIGCGFFGPVDDS